MRIDDSDTPRNVKDATDSILKTLSDFGLHWDGSVSYQSKHCITYDTVLESLKDQDLTYPCVCTRKSLANYPVYPGVCLKIKAKNNVPHALRIKSNKVDVIFDDELQGHHLHQMIHQHGDFIIRRKDNIMAYQLAVVIDDHLQNISHVIRGYDLLDSTPKQIFLQHTLGYSTPHYCHVPLIVDQNGNKLSKQTFAQAVSSESTEKTLFFLLDLLRQNPPIRLKNSSIKKLLDWAIKNWNPQYLKKTRAINDRIY